MARTIKGTRQGLTFNPGNHTYRLDGKPVPGVTGLLGVLDKPAIPKWAARTVAEWVADNPDAVEILRESGRIPLVTTLANVPWEKRDKAATRGKDLHAFAEDLLYGREIDVADVPDDLIPVLEHAIAFLDTWQIRPLLVEAPVAHRGDWWAGTLDLVADYVDPRTGEPGRAIFDWKSGKALYPEYAWQLNAYAHAEFSSVDGVEAPLPEIGAAFGVHIRPDGYDVAPFAFGPKIYEEFVAIRRVAEIVKAGRGDWKVPGSGHVGLMIQLNEEAAQ